MKLRGQYRYDDHGDLTLRDNGSSDDVTSPDGNLKRLHALW